MSDTNMYPWKGGKMNNTNTTVRPCRQCGHENHCIPHNRYLSPEIETCDMWTPKQPAPVVGKDATGLLELLKRFYAVWNRCVATRGCYSCAEPHDCRCEKDRGISEVCNCGRDELEALENRIDEYGVRTWIEKQPAAQDVMAVLEDVRLREEVAERFFKEEMSWNDLLFVLGKYGAAMMEKLKEIK
jgi:hypothetical protein